MTEPLLAPAATEDPRIGTVLAERYRVVRKLGQGGMGIVYEGVHTVIGRRVAIKMLHGQFATNADVVARFHREAVAATAIGHPHIVEVIDMARAPDGAVFMVLEFLDGRDWAHDLDATGPQPLGRVIRILSTVLDALAAAHAKKIVHRDLKPENVFLVSRPGDPDFVKLVDFGISKILDEPGTTDGKGLTQTGAAMGTPYYMAPEQMAGKKDIDHRADLYSVGVMLYQAVTGAYPFDGDTIAMLALKVLSTEPAPLATHVRDVPEGLQAIVDRALAKEPAQRFATAAEMREALARWRDDTAPVSAIRQARSELPTMPAVEIATRAGATREMPGQAAPSATPPSTGVRSGVIGLGAATLLVVAGLALWSRDPAPTPVATTAMAASDDVHIVIATVPAGADLRFDGLAVANPFDGEIARSREPHHIEARAPGHAAVERDITLLADQHITLTLEPAGIEAPLPPPPTTTTTTTIAHHVPHPPATHAPEATTVPVVATAPPPTTPTPEPPHDEPARPSDRLLRPF